jgi:ABC-2 type transport system ATP-binding protein
LKTSLGAGYLLNLECSNLLGAMAALEGKKGILDIAVFGGGLHIKVDDPGAAIPAIYKILEAAGIHVLTLDAITPSMEDVFVSLIEQEEAKKAA